MMQHRISVGGLIIRDNQLLLFRHHHPGIYDFWAAPGGGVEDDEQLTETLEREVFEETGLKVQAKELAYIDELIDNNGRMVKFWFIVEIVGGSIELECNPADEGIIEARWFGVNDLPSKPLFPPVIRTDFWTHLKEGFNYPRKLPLLISYY